MKNGKLTKFDESTRQGHSYLRAEDDCFYLIESTAGKGFDHSDANGLISNFKKKPSVKGTYQWSHKLTAIRAAAETLLRELPASWLRKSIFVPIPPSMSKEDPEYDDRMSRPRSARAWPRFPSECGPNGPGPGWPSNRQWTSSC